MGIPKFYRWLSERYPCLSEVLKEYQIPEFDNLYLDMNGIIHTCSHPDDSSVYIQVSEDKIFSDICHYIEVLFRMIKPKKIFYMAVDGVAPRAKMNQQRSRRFRSAKEAELITQKEMKKSGKVPTGTRFDSNCITPGSEFMVRLNAVLKEFVASKVKSDPLWQRPLIIFSGHEAPGEGEHKVMDFIRREKSRPYSSFDPNTKHCLYGLDADLIMLSLVTHEPHFSLLREEVKFTKNQKRSVLPEDTTFHLLHISLLRDYLNLEFALLQDGLSFGYNLERIIDDWVLMAFLVGNDFIPHLPNLHIHHDCLPLLWKAYKESLPSLGGYLNEGGVLNLSRFEKYLSKLHQFDYDKFEEKHSDSKWLDGKRKGRKNRKNANKQDKNQNNSEGIRVTKLKKIGGNEVVNDDEDTTDDEDISDIDDDEDDVAIQDVKFSLSSELVGIPSATEFLESSSNHDTEGLQSSVEASSLTFECDELMCEEFKKFKAEYYMEKFNYEAVDDKILQTLANEYVEAIQWILHYYYNGIQSWSWFYPHHYAPFLSDVRNFSNLKLTFDLGKPFLPYQQLMAILPRASKQLLPLAFQRLMDPYSPVEDYYPEDFQTDLNGKLQEWEAVVLIPFINEKILLGAMEPLFKKLSDEEKGRNKHGPHNLHCHRGFKDRDYYLPVNKQFKEEGHIAHWDLPDDYFALKVKDLYKGLCKGVNLKSLCYGFPTLRHVPHDGKLENLGVKVFDRASAHPSMALILKSTKDVTIDNVGKSLIGRVTLINWPHLNEVLVVHISNDEVKVRPKNEIYQEESLVTCHKMELNHNEEANWHKEAEFLKDNYLNRFGIKVGETQLLLGARRLVGKKFMVKTSGEVVLEKHWSNVVDNFLYQTSVEYNECKNPYADEHYRLSDFFHRGANVFLLANPHYGSEGRVLEILTSENRRVLGQFIVPIEPNLERPKARAVEFDGSFLPAYLVSQRLAISSHLLSRVTGTIFLVDDATKRKINVGLNLKFNKQNMEVPGYTKKVDRDWLYSSKVVDLMTTYIEKFPELFRGIASMSNNDNFSTSEIFKKNGSEMVSEIEAFLKSLPMKSLEPRPHGTKLLNSDIIEEIEREVVSVAKSKSTSTTMKIKPHLLYMPKVIHSPCAPDERATMELFDRVVNIRPGYTVPLGLRGTVVGIEPGEKKQDYLYHILFDKEFEGSMPLRCGNNRKCYRVPANSLINITHGIRMSQSANRRNVNSNINHQIVQSRVNGHHGVPQQLVINLNDDRLMERRAEVVSPREGWGRQDMSSAVVPQVLAKPDRNTNYHDEHIKARCINDNDRYKQETNIIDNYKYRKEINIDYELARVRSINSNGYKQERNINDNDGYRQVWSQLKGASKVQGVKNKSQVAPMPPKLKPPQAWIDKTNKNNLQDSSQIGKKISVEELLRSAESSLQKVTINGHVQPIHILNNCTSAAPPHRLGNEVQQQHHQQQRQRQEQHNHRQPDHPNSLVFRQQEKYNHGQKQQVFHHHHHQQQQQPYTINNRWFSLMTFCQVNNLSRPKYESRWVERGVQGRIFIKERGCITGPVCDDEPKASEEASSLALYQLQQNHYQLNGPSIGNAHIPYNGPPMNPPNMKQNAHQPSLNPKANTFIPTQVLQRQKSTKAPTSIPQDQPPIKDQISTSSFPQDRDCAEQPRAMGATNHADRRVTTRKSHKKRIAALFATPTTN